MMVLNLYAGLGGNRKLWSDCEVTAVEIDPVLGLHVLNAALNQKQKTLFSEKEE